jgi:hypothetical protein
MFRSLFLLTVCVMSVWAEHAYVSGDLVPFNEEHKVHSSGHDLYRLVYDGKTQECSLYRNGRKIPLFDPRFKKKAPRTPYTCASWQKMQYRGCRQQGAKSVSAAALSYGVYPSTNFLFGFKADHPRVDAYMEVECSRQGLGF